MANSQYIHFSTYISLNQIWLAGKVSWNPVWHPQGHSFSHEPKVDLNQAKSSLLVELRSCLCEARLKFPALILEIPGDDSAWSWMINFSCPSYFHYCSGSRFLETQIPNGFLGVLSLSGAAVRPVITYFSKGRNQVLKQRSGFAGAELLRHGYKQIEQGRMRTGVFLLSVMEISMEMHSYCLKSVEPGMLFLAEVRGKERSWNS